MDQLKIGRFIAGLRKEQGMTQLDLATKLGVTDRAVSKWENGRGLPDLSLIKPLCEVLSISINELLSGERIKEETLEIANENMIGVLSDREREIKKRRRITLMSVILSVISVVLSIIFVMTFGGLLTAQLRGDGYSFSSVYYTLKARRVVEYIADGDYEKASKLIGFYTEDRDATEKKWIESMEELSETIYIEHFTTCDMYEDDHAVFGYTTMIVYDCESKKGLYIKSRLLLKTAVLHLAPQTRELMDMNAISRWANLSTKFLKHGMPDKISKLASKWFVTAKTKIRSRKRADFCFFHYSIFIIHSNGFS